MTPRLGDQRQWLVMPLVMKEIARSIQSSAADSDRVHPESLQPERSSHALVDRCDQEEIAFLPWAPIQALDRLPKLMDSAERHGATG